jgi:hypothetical protein
MLAALHLLGVTALTTTNQAFAWADGGGYDNQGWNGGCVGYSCSGGGGVYENGYNAGISDAVYDHENGLAYNPVGNCLPCHSQEYWDNFSQGYEHQWNTYQSTHQTVNNYVTVNGNGNDVNINNRQNSDLSNQEPSWNGENQPQGCCGYGSESGENPDP